MSTLKKFHSEMSTEFWIPTVTVRTKNLDLHKLIVEVTSRGGIKQVVHEEKWKDVIDKINIPKTIPMISSRVRKHYYSLLHDYEIVYFSKARGQECMHIQLEQRPVRSETTIHMEKSSDLIDTSLWPASGTVVLEGRFENGYCVTVTIGSKKLRGVVYPKSPPLKTVTKGKLDADENDDLTDTSSEGSD